MAMTDRGAVRVAGAIFLIAAGTIMGAWTFEAFGYAPCELCLAQRLPYYVGIPFAALTVLLAARGPARLRFAAFAGLALLFAASAGFGAYHAGVEWGFWPGPGACSGGFDPPRSVTDFFAQLNKVRVVRCDAPAIRILGLSLAGWNAVVSVLLGALAMGGMRLRRESSRGSSLSENRLS